MKSGNVRRGFVFLAEFENLHRALLDYLKDPIGFAYVSAWRIGEIKSLEWRDVDLRESG